MYVNQGGTWRTIAQPKVKVGGTWRTIVGGWVNVNGTWRRYYPGTVEATILVVGGGGGGGIGAGDEGGGGGGGGGVVLVNNVILDATQTYAVTVGAGGPVGSNGKDSSFSGSFSAPPGTSLGATASYSNAVIPPSDNISDTCFPAGSQVLMADLTWKNIESVQVGELMYSVDGPAECVKEYVTTLGNRRMITFADQSIFWSEEHAFWTRENDRDWWWSYNADRWRGEVERGVIGGLLDNNSIRTGEIEQEYAHVNGWRRQKSQVAVGMYSENFPLYVPLTNGEPIVVNGYLVGAGVNEHAFDYTKIDWDKIIAQYKNMETV